MAAKKKVDKSTEFVEPKQKRYRMPTQVFFELWINNRNDWTAFVTACHRAFCEIDETNVYLLNEEQSNWKNWNIDKIQAFMSERCYVKAIGLQKKFKKVENGARDIPLPKGYLDRVGTGGGSKRVSAAELLARWDSQVFPK